MKQITELKTKLAQIHLTTDELNSELLALKETIKSLKLEETIIEAILYEIDKSIKLNNCIRKLSKPKGK